VSRGAARAGDGRFDGVAAFLRTLTVLDLDLEAAIAVGSFDAKCHARGNPLRARDTLVASPALRHGYALVTLDRDSEAVEELELDYYDET